MTGALLANGVDLSRMEGDVRLAKVVEHYVAVGASMIHAGEFDRGRSAEWPKLTQVLTEPGMVKLDTDVGGITIAGYSFVVSKEDKSIAVHDAQLGEGEPLFTISATGQVTKHYQSPGDVGYSEDPVRTVFKEIGALHTPATVALALNWKSE